VDDVCLTSLGVEEADVEDVDIEEVLLQEVDVIVRQSH
jgi:hypothetical protein